MIKQQKPILKSIGNFKLYLEDIIELLNILETAEAENIKVVINDYEIKNVEKLSDDKFSTIKMLELKSQNPYINITYYGNKINLYIDNNNYKNIGVSNEIMDIISKTQNHKALKLKKTFDKGLFIPVGIYLGLRFNNDKIKQFDIFIIFYIAIALLFDLNPLKDKGTIYNYYSKNKTNFWLRNKESIVVNLIFLVLGSFLTVVIQKIFT